MRKKSFLIISAVFLLFFFIITLITSGNAGFLIDEAVVFWAENVTSKLALMMMTIASLLGSSEMILIVTVVIGLVLLIKRNWNMFFFFFSVSVGGVLLNFVLKTLIKRARPGDEVSYIEAFNVQLEVQSYSFPSGHTMRAAILFMFLIYLSHKYLSRELTKYLSYAIYVILLLLVAVSRVILDAHFVTDVIGALFISVAWFFICLYFFHKEERAIFPYNRYHYRY